MKHSIDLLVIRFVVLVVSKIVIAVRIFVGGSDCGGYIHTSNLKHFLE